jgi:ribosomal-protein-alanine N-acetyltransferase
MGLKHTGTITIKTPRLTLRMLNLDDVAAMHRNWASDVEVYRYMTSQRMPEPEDVERFIKNKLMQYEKLDFYYWGIVPDDCGEVVGMVTLTEVSNGSKTANIAYALGRPWWGHGYAREAVEAVLSLMFRTVGMRKIYGCHFSANVRSGNVLTSVGMKHTGKSKEPMFHKGEYLPYENYELTARSYFNRQYLLGCDKTVTAPAQY